MITIVVVLDIKWLWVMEVVNVTDFYFYITQKRFSYKFYFLVSMLHELLLLKAGLYDSWSYPF